MPPLWRLYNPRPAASPRISAGGYQHRPVGAWRSLVAHQHGALGAVGSNPAAPTNSPTEGPIPSLHANTDTITTARLSLRRFRAQDVAAFHLILSDPQAMRYWSTPPHRDVGETEAWIAKTIAAVAAGEADDFIAEHQGRVIGKAGASGRNSRQ